jgi:DNA-binding XRE family transcriptional regulator
MVKPEGNSMGTLARKVRISLRLTQQQLAKQTGVSPETVYLFEHNLPVFLDARRRIIKELWAIKARKQSKIWKN